MQEIPLEILQTGCAEINRLPAATTIASHLSCRLSNAQAYPLLFRLHLGLLSQLRNKIPYNTATDHSGSPQMTRPAKAVHAASILGCKIIYP
jgi:hypothetical protein